MFGAPERNDVASEGKYFKMYPTFQENNTEALVISKRLKSP